MGDELYQWCQDVKMKNPHLDFNCENIEGTNSNSGTPFNIVSILNEEICKKDNKSLEEEIAEKRRLVKDLKNLVNTKKYLTQTRQLQENKKIEKKVYYEMLGISIILVLSIFSNVLLIYYFFVFRRK